MKLIEYIEKEKQYAWVKHNVVTHKILGKTYSWNKTTGEWETL